MKTNADMKPETAGNTPEPKVQVGEWFFLESPNCTNRFSVQEKTHRGSSIVCSTPYHHDYAKRQLQEIVTSHNERVAASSHPKTEDGNTPEPLTPIERAARRLAANHTICSQIYSEKWRVEHIEQVLESELGMVAASSKEATPELRDELIDLRGDILSGTGTREMTVVERNAVSRIEALLRRCAEATPSPATKDSTPPGSDLTLENLLPLFWELIDAVCGKFNPYAVPDSNNRWREAVALCKRKLADAPSPAREETPDENKLLDGICSDIEYARKWHKQDSWLALAILNRLPKSADAGARSVAVAPQPQISLDVFQHDWGPGFGSFLHDGSLAEGAHANITLNLGSLLCAVKTGHLDKRDLPYFIAETLMHEAIHALEAWANVEFSEDRVEELLQKYREKYSRATIWEYTGGEPHEAVSQPNEIEQLRKELAEWPSEIAKVTGLGNECTPEEASNYIAECCNTLWERGSFIKQLEAKLAGVAALPSTKGGK